MNKTLITESLSHLRKMWEWQGDEFALQEDVPKIIWNDVSQNEDLSYMFDDITPIKACGDVGYHATNSENTKNVKTCKPSSSQVKRWRMLQFDSEVLKIPYCNEEMRPTFLKTKTYSYYSLDKGQRWRLFSWEFSSSLQVANALSVNLRQLDNLVED